MTFCVLSILPNGRAVCDAESSVEDAPVGCVAGAMDNLRSVHFLLLATSNVRTGDTSAVGAADDLSLRSVLLAEIFCFP